MLRRLLLLAILSHFLWVKGQGSVGQKDSLELRENIHLHLNKTTFLQGEQLWFKAYVLDQNTKTPAFGTTNLHVAIFDKSGMAIKQKLLYIENGMSAGDFTIDSTMTDSEYTVLAWTSYLRNFKELRPFRQQIKVLRGDSDSKVEPDAANMKISVYPEGGELISDAYNSIGILLDNGAGQGLKTDELELVDGIGNIVRSNITTNEFGMGKTGFMVDANKSYFLQLKRRGLSNIRTPLPVPLEGRLGLSIDNTGDDQVLMRLVGSESAFESKEGKTYSLAFYQDEYLEFENIEINEDEFVLAVKRELMPIGVITAVLFDTDLEPVAHRMFFNHKITTSPSVVLDYCPSAIGDSLQIDLIIPGEMERQASVSVSVLPGNSIAYGNDNNIVSSFLLRPYVRQDFKERYFFEVQDRKKHYELDNRLLIEGWGRYDWDSRTLEDIKLEFQTENGIPFKGRILDADLNQEKQISLVAQLSGALQFEELKKDKTFSGNMLLFEGDSLEVSLIGNKGKLRKPKAEVEFESLSKPFEEVNNWLQNPIIKNEFDSVRGQFVYQKIDLDKRTIALREVVVTDKKLESNKFQISAFVEGRTITDLDIRRSPSVASYFRQLGFIISGNGGALRVFIPDGQGGLQRVPVAIEGMATLDGELIGKPLSNVRFLTYSKNRLNPFISIMLNPNYVPPEQRNKFVKFAIENGYAHPQEYFTPNYPDYDNRIFQNYGALDWKANVSIGSEIPNSINIPINNQEEIQLYIEGMSVDGSLISKTERINLSKELK